MLLTMLPWTLLETLLLDATVTAYPEVSDTVGYCEAVKQKDPRPNLGR